MEQMYQDYKGIVEFRMVYIREAHAADSDRPNRISRSKGINEHTNYDERCTTAKMLLEDERLTIPMLIDGMNNAANLEYSAKPDRVFLVRSDGRLAVAADPGPRGFNPALREVERWLEDFSETGAEPELPEEVVVAADKATAKRASRRASALAKQISQIEGGWNVANELEGNSITSEITLSIKDGVATGIATAGGQTARLNELRFDGRQISFSLKIHDSPMEFVGSVDGEVIAGELLANGSTYQSTWTRK